jgi:hypothetical protein
MGLDQQRYKIIRHKCQKICCLIFLNHYMMRGKTAANIEHEKQPPLLKKLSNCLKSTYPKNSRHGKLRREAFLIENLGTRYTGVMLISMKPV